MGKQPLFPNFPTHRPLIIDVISRSPELCMSKYTRNPYTTQNVHNLELIQKKFFVEYNINSKVLYYI